MSESRFRPMRVVRVVDETADARSFVLTPTADEAAGFVYEAGQFLTLAVPLGGRSLHRCYSFSSSPEWDDEIRITVKRVDDGRVSNWLNDNLHAGDTLSAMPPAGRFVLRDHAGPLLLFAGGSGITPVMSLLKTALLGTDRQVSLVYANRDAPSVIFADELAAIETRYAGRFHVHHRLDDRDGFLDAATVTRLVGERRDRDVYLCGPEVFMTLIEQCLADLGVSRDHLFVERFASPSDGELPAAVVTAESTPVDAGTLPDEIEVHLRGESRRVAYEAGQTILQAARAAGLDAPSACEEGYCATCVARLSAGRASMSVNDVLTDAEVADGLVLTCQALPTTTEVVVVYED